MRNVQQWLQQQKEINLRQKAKEEEEKKLLKKARVKEYHQQHREEIREYQRNYRLQHSAELQQKAKVYRDNHREYYREYWRNRQKGIPTKKLDTYQQPPVKSKKQAKEIYQKWLQQLQEREQFLTGEKLHWNQLMQESLKQTLMGRNKLSIEQVHDKINDLKELIADLQERRRQTTNDEEKNDLTRKIALANGNLSTYKRKYKSLFPKPKEEKPLITRSIVRNKLEEIEQKAKQMMALAKTDEEVKVIKERLEICRLRVKYSYN
ncbi:hypothetical protein [uncultured Methanobrevibacter sp.]|uniref:hypothetical protein n=1 Tax=uncultured Methanobrevibacter sp. TaxID=253161 RepID=UPI0025D8469D|nr:hypothetical protein [uncultured Methanobrevibacter sp.]